MKNRRREKENARNNFSLFRRIKNSLLACQSSGHCALCIYVCMNDVTRSLVFTHTSSFRFVSIRFVISSSSLDSDSLVFYLSVLVFRKEITDSLQSTYKNIFGKTLVELLEISDKNVHRIYIIMHIFIISLLRYIRIILIYRLINISHIPKNFD